MGSDENPYDSFDAKRGEAMSTILDLNSVPDDFYCLIDDLLGNYYDTEDQFTSVKVRMGLLSDHLAIFEEEQTYWSSRDFELVVEYAEAIQRGDKFPPLVADTEGGTLRDGFHRMGAYLSLGIETVGFIYLDEQG